MKLFEKQKPDILQDVAKFRQAFYQLNEMGDSPAEWRLSQRALEVAYSDECFITRDSILNVKTDGWMRGAPVFIDDNLGRGVGELIGKAGNRVTFQVEAEIVRPYIAGK